MAAPVAPVQPCRSGGPFRVIQGFFPGGQPRILAPTPVVPRPASVQAAVALGRPNFVPSAARISAVQPAARSQPNFPNGARPGAIQPFAVGAPAATRAILPSPPAADAFRSQSLQLSGGAQAFAVPSTLDLSVSGGGQRLPEAVQQKMESFFGASFADVRVHVGSQAPSIGALAFTHGSNLYFAPGQYNPGTLEGQRLLGHELTHVIQQRAGRVRNPFGSGVAVVQDQGLESEADRMGLRAASHQVTVQAKAAAPMRGDPSIARPVQLLATTRQTHAQIVMPGFVQRSEELTVSGPAMVGNSSYRIVAGAGGQQVGSVLVHKRGGSAIEVTDLAVNPSHRKQGLGSVLMASAMRTGLQLGKTKVTLASQDNGTGRLTAWYKNMGFHQVGSSKQGYPLLEAPIGQALFTAVQGRMKVNPHAVGVQAKIATPRHSLERDNPSRISGGDGIKSRLMANVLKPLAPPVVQRAATVTAPATVVTTWLTATDLKDSVMKEFAAWNKTAYYPTGVTGPTPNGKTVQTHSAHKADYLAALTLIGADATPLGYFVKGDGFSRGENFLAADIIISKDPRHGKDEPKMIFHLWTGVSCNFA